LAAGWWTNRRLLLLPLLFFFGLGTAMYWQAREPLLPPAHLVHLPGDRQVTLAGRLARPSKMGPERLQLFVAAEAWLSPRGWQPVEGLLLVSAPRQEARPVGSRLMVRGTLHTPRRLNNPGAFDRPRHLAAEGIFRTLAINSTDDLVWLATGTYPLRERLRGGVRALLRDLLPEARAMYLAMLLGDQGEITQPMREAFSRTGTSHLLVINGLHLGAVAGVAYSLSFWLLRFFPWVLLRLNAVKAATLLAAGPVLAYAWVAGGSPSTQRAEVMVLAYLLLLFLGRPRETWSALALAALVILAMSPLRLFSASFALSFAAVAGILYIKPALGRFGTDPAPVGSGWGRWPGRAVRRGWEALSVSLAASLATAPLVAWFFNVVSFLGILVNLVAIPLVLMAALPLGELAVLAQALGQTAAARALIQLGEWPLWLGWQAIAQGAKVPGAACSLPTPTWLQVGLYVACLGLWGYRPRRRFTLAGAGLAAGMLALTMVLPWRPTPAGCEITVLDSPTGLNAVVVAPDGRRLAVFAGRPSYPGREEVRTGTLTRYLRVRQFSTLDGAVGLNLTSANAPDLLEVVRTFGATAWWVSPPSEWSESGLALVNELGDRGVRPLAAAGNPAAWQWGGMEVRLLPVKGAAALEVSGFGRRVLLLPPVSQAGVEHLEAGGLGVLEAVVAGQPPSLGWLARQQPRRLILYERPAAGTVRAPPATRLHYTSQGAFTLLFGPQGVEAFQYDQYDRRQEDSGQPTAGRWRDAAPQAVPGWPDG
jgi:ComEC/Rec2-related protein